MVNVVIRQSRSLELIAGCGVADVGADQGQQQIPKAIIGGDPQSRPRLAAGPSVKGKATSTM